MSKPYHSTYSVVFACNYHVVWCTKYRRRVLTEAIQTRLLALIDEQQTEYRYSVQAAEVMPDHVHLVCEVSPQLAVSHVVGKLKGYTSRVLRAEYPQLVTRLPMLWTRSKFIASASTVTLDVLKRYVESQKN